MQGVLGCHSEYATDGKAECSSAVVLHGAKGCGAAATAPPARSTLQGRQPAGCAHSVTRGTAKPSSAVMALLRQTSCLLCLRGSVPLLKGGETAARLGKGVWPLQGQCLTGQPPTALQATGEHRPRCCRSWARVRAKAGNASAALWQATGPCALVLHRMHLCAVHNKQQRACARGVQWLRSCRGLRCGTWGASCNAAAGQRPLSWTATANQPC